MLLALFGTFLQTLWLFVHESPTGLAELLKGYHPGHQSVIIIIRVNNTFLFHSGDLVYLKEWLVILSLYTGHDRQIPDCDEMRKLTLTGRTLTWIVGGYCIFVPVP